MHTLGTLVVWVLIISQCSTELQRACDLQCLTNQHLTNQHFTAAHFHKYGASCSCRVYDSSLDFPTATERHVYPIVLDRAAQPLRVAIKPLLPASALGPRLAPPAFGSRKIRSVPSG